MDYYEYPKSSLRLLKKSCWKTNNNQGKQDKESLVTDYVVEIFVNETKNFNK